MISSAHRSARRASIASRELVLPSVSLGAPCARCTSWWRKQRVVELLADRRHQLTQHTIAVNDEVLVAAHCEPVAEVARRCEHLTVDVDPVGDGLVEGVVEAAVQRRGDGTGVADDAHEDGVGEDLRHLLHVGGVERRLVTPAGLPLRPRVPLEHAGVEVAEPRVELLLGPADPAEPLSTVLPAGDARVASRAPMKPVSPPIAIRGWLSRIRRSMVEPDRMEPTMKIGAPSMRAIMGPGPDPVALSPRTAAQGGFVRGGSRP